MERNLLLAMALSILVLLLWSSLQPPRELREPARPPREEQQSEPQAPQRGPVMEAVPAAPPAEVPEAVVEPNREEKILHVERPLYRAELSDRGAALRHWELRNYDTGGAAPEPIVLTTGEAPHGLAGLTPFRELGVGDLGAAFWSIEAQDPDGITFVVRRGDVLVRKTWRFEDAYQFRLILDVENRSADPVTTDFEVRWPAHRTGGNDFREQALAVLHEGSLKREMLQSLGVGGFFGRLTGREPQRTFEFPGDNDWAGMNTTYFMAVLLPDDPAQAQVRFDTVDPGVAGEAQIFFEPVRIPPGLPLSREFTGFLGPKLPDLLEEVGGDTVRALDVGWAWVAPLSHFFAWLLHEIYAVIPNYGVAIILLTILVRAVTTPLTLRQMRSMERMRAVQPRVKEIQEKYKEDRQKQSEEMMRLYRQEKVNPLGGCVPMLFQLPVFIGLFYALRSSIQLRQAPFFGWIHDLSAPEVLFVIPGLDLPVRVLPLVMGVTMVVQQRITPMQADPAQARMMQTVMPIVMTVVFYQFASGLVLYWMVSNVLAIAHQLWVGRRMRSGDGAAAKA